MSRDEARPEVFADSIEEGILLKLSDLDHRLRKLEEAAQPKCKTCKQPLPEAD